MKCQSKVFFSRVHATLKSALSVVWSVGRSHYVFWWFCFFDLAAPAQMVWWPQICTFHSLCPPARDFGSRVSGFVQLTSCNAKNSPAYFVWWLTIWKRSNLINEAIPMSAKSLRDNDNELTTNWWPDSHEWTVKEGKMGRLKWDFLHHQIKQSSYTQW